MLEVYDMFESRDEPSINLCQVFNLLHAIAFFQSLSDGKDAEVGWVGKFLVEILELHMVVAHKSVHALPYHTQTFLHHLFERTADRHDFTY